MREGKVVPINEESRPCFEEMRQRGNRQQTFRFADPMMRPYVIIRGIQSKMINDAAKTILLQREQRRSPSSLRRLPCDFSSARARLFSVATFHWPPQPWINWSRKKAHA